MQEFGVSAYWFLSITPCFLLFSSTSRCFLLILCSDMGSSKGCNPFRGVPASAWVLHRLKSFQVCLCSGMAYPQASVSSEVSLLWLGVPPPSPSVCLLISPPVSSLVPPHVFPFECPHIFCVSFCVSSCASSRVSSFYPWIFPFVHPHCLVLCFLPLMATALKYI